MEQLKLNILTPEHRAALEKELHELKLCVMLLPVYYPPDEYCKPTSKIKGKKPIPQAKWDYTMKQAERVREINEILDGN